MEAARYLHLNFGLMAITNELCEILHGDNYNHTQKFCRKNYLHISNYKRGDSVKLWSYVWQI